MSRTVISLSLPTADAKKMSEMAREQGKTRSQFLRDLAMGHVRISRFKQLRQNALRHWRPDWPQTEEEVVAMVRDVRHQSARARGRNGLKK